MTMFTSRPIVSALCLALAACTWPMMQGCSSTPHSQQVRHDARDRFDRAGAQITYDQARQAFSSGQFEEALAHIDRAIARFPKESSYYLLQGRILNEMKRADQAYAAFQKAVELDPRKPEPHYFRGIVLQRWRQLEEAREAYATAAELDPFKLHYVSAEVEVLTALQRYDEAEQRLAAVNNRFEYSPVLDRLRADIAKCRGNDALCADMLERAGMREELTPDAVEELAFARFAIGDWVGVINALNRPELRQAQSRPDLARLRARCLLMLGRAAEARDLLLTLRARSEFDPRTQVLLGYAAWRVGDWQTVRDSGQTLVNADPTLADGHLFLGGADYAQGRLSDSVVHFERAVVRDPERETARRMLAESNARLARGGAPGPASPLGAPAAGVVRTEAP